MTNMDREFVSKASKMDPEGIAFLAKILSLSNENPAVCDFIYENAKKYPLKTPSGRAAFLAAIQAV